KMSSRDSSSNYFARISSILDGPPTLPPLSWVFENLINNTNNGTNHTLSPLRIQNHIKILPTLEPAYRPTQEQLNLPLTL
ncbi:10229_t:CDS:1, partial [Rhizophagus irregularis]